MALETVGASLQPGSLSRLRVPPRTKRRGYRPAIRKCKEDSVPMAGMQHILIFSISLSVKQVASMDDSGPKRQQGAFTLLDSSKSTDLQTDPHHHPLLRRSAFSSWSTCSSRRTRSRRAKRQNPTATWSSSPPRACRARSGSWSPSGDEPPRAQAPRAPPHGTGLQLPQGLRVGALRSTPRAPLLSRAAPQARWGNTRAV